MPEMVADSFGWGFYLGFIGGGVFMYLWLRLWFGRARGSGDG